MPAETESDFLTLILHYLRIIRARKRIIIVILGLGLFAGYIVSCKLPRVYRASCLIQVQPPKPDIEAFSSDKVDQYDINFLRTQFELIQSDQVVEEVVRTLNLTESFEEKNVSPKEEDSTKAFDRIVKLISSKIKVQERKNTNLIEISVELDRPESPKGEAAIMAARISNKVGEVFRDQTLRKKREITTRALEELQREIKSLDKQIAEKEQQLELQRRKYNINDKKNVPGGENRERAIEQARTVRSNAEIALQQKRDLLEQVILLREQNLIRVLANLVQNKTLDSLLTEWSLLEIELRANLSSSLGPKHPRMKRLRAKIDQLNNRIGEEVDAICLGLKADYDTTRTTYNHLTERFAQLMNQEKELAQGVYRKYQKLSREIESLRERRNKWEENYIQERLKLHLPQTSVHIVQKAKENRDSSPVNPQVSVIIISGALIALVFGIGIVLILEYANTSIKTSDDIKRHLKTKVLGAIPHGVTYVNKSDTYVKYAEYYRILRTNVKSTKQWQEGCALCVTSGGAKEGKSQTLFNLAYVCAKLGDRVLIIDSDLYHPSQHEILDAHRHPGLSNFLLGESSLAEIVQHTLLPNLDFIPAGRPRDGMTGLHETQMLITAIRDMKRHYEWILLDSPPMVGTSDASELVRVADRVLLVVQHRKYPRNMLQHVRERIEYLGGNLLGVVMNKIKTPGGDSSSKYQINGISSGGHMAKNKIQLWDDDQFKRKIGA